MKTNNPFIDNMIEVQTKAVNNWMDTTKKIQESFSGGKIQNEAQSIYNEWLERQMNIFGGSQTADGNVNTNSFYKPEEFFKSWFNMQNEHLKQMNDFNQNIYNGFSAFGKTAENMNQWSQMNNAWNSVYTNWMNAVNSTYDAMSKNMAGSDAQDAFKKFFDGNKTYNQLKDFWSNVYKAWQNQELNNDFFNNMVNGEAYKRFTEQMFSQNFQSGSMKEFFDASMRNMNNYFSGNTDLYKEYTSTFQNMANHYPQLMSGDFSKLSELFSEVKNVFGKSFAPVLNMMAPGKEKQNLENTIQLMDNVSLYTLKQSQFQHLFYTSSKKAMESVVNQMTEKMKQTTNMTEVQGFNEFYNEWLKINEAEFTKLYNSDEFSKLKSELMAISADVKSTFEHQFQENFSVYPLVFRSEMEELHKTIYELKKQVKSLEAKLGIDSSKEDKTTKKK